MAMGTRLVRGGDWAKWRLSNCDTRVHAECPRDEYAKRALEDGGKNGQIAPPQDWREDWCDGELVFNRVNASPSETSPGWHSLINTLVCMLVCVFLDVCINTPYQNDDAAMAMTVWPAAPPAPRSTSTAKGHKNAQGTNCSSIIIKFWLCGQPNVWQMLETI